MQMRTSIKRVGCRLNTTSSHPSYYDDFSTWKHILRRDVAVSVKRRCVWVLITSRNIFRQCHPPSGPPLRTITHQTGGCWWQKYYGFRNRPCSMYFVNRINESILLASARISIILQTSFFLMPDNCDNIWFLKMRFSKIFSIFSKSFLPR